MLPILTMIILIIGLTMISNALIKPEDHTEFCSKCGSVKKLNQRCRKCK